MSYPARQPRRGPSTRETVLSEFTRADGTCDALGSLTRVTGPSPRADSDGLVIYQKRELSCSCIWPDVEVAGVCAECAAEEANPYVCKVHYVVCGCGTSCCWKHSRPSEDGATRICTRCKIRQDNERLKGAVVGAVVRTARWLFSR